MCARDSSQSSACRGPSALPSPRATHDRDRDPCGLPSCSLCRGMGCQDSRVDAEVGLGPFLACSPCDFLLRASCLQCWPRSWLVAACGCPAASWPVPKHRPGSVEMCCFSAASCLVVSLVFRLCWNLLGEMSADHIKLQRSMLVWPLAGWPFLSSSQGEHSASHEWNSLFFQAIKKIINFDFFPPVFWL